MTGSTRLARPAAAVIARAARDGTLESLRPPCHTIHMKRTNLVLREDLLHEAVRLSGERTYSRTVERALEDLVRRIKARRILDLAGSGAWTGDLSEMRGDRPRRARRGRRAAR